MQFITNSESIFNIVADCKKNNQVVGLVATMGALHDGHISLIKKARETCDVVIATIFVNPTQFHKEEDFQKYPNTIEKDKLLLAKADCDFLFHPSVDMIYKENPTIIIRFPHIQKYMEGKYRKGHFEGVALIVSKLFHIIPAQYAFFGQKDWQQVLIIKQIIKELLFPIQLVIAPTVREADGLALSSRNMRLTQMERNKATIFIQALVLAQKLFREKENTQYIKQKIKQKVNAVDGVTLEYFEIANRETLRSVSSSTKSDSISFFIAGYVGNIRLIDNIFLEETVDL
ncbi:MAG: pantoate--beta-alanine ligase [Chitinophagaceae bacterium]|nr:pantoate--beta-alanine ligase [Chitinophagaceae bacterium]